MLIRLPISASIVVFPLFFLSSCLIEQPFEEKPYFRENSVGKTVENQEESEVEIDSEQEEVLEEMDYSLEYHLPQGRKLGYYKIGAPYKIYDVLYEPKNYEDFEEVGTASWYGDYFHGKKTANGEIYNMRDLTAAHPTLPLPSLVRVTNMRNNKSAIVRVNDRGPFAKDRIIDVSQRAAEVLDFRSYGTTEVKVEFLKKETDEFLVKYSIK